MTTATTGGRLAARLRALPPPARHLPGKHDQSTHGNHHGGGKSGGSGGGGGYAPATRTSISDWSDGDIADVLAANVEDYHRDDRLLELWRKQGFTGTPQVVPAAEFDALGDNHTKVFRGLHTAGDGKTGAEYAEEFRTGDEPYPGLGIFGNGTYTTTRQDKAEDYTGDELDALLRMALVPDARIAEIGDLEDVLDSGELTGDVADLVGDDAGKLATLLGFDAFKRRDNVVVLNRTALVIQEAA